MKKMSKMLLKAIKCGLLLLIIGILLLTGCQQKEELSTFNISASPKHMEALISEDLVFNRYKGKSLKKTK